MTVIRRVVLILGAILGSLFLIAGIAAVAFDGQALIFRSGSMSPSIEAGALGFSHTVDATDLAVGDIVSVKTAEGQRVTHRIAAISRSGSSASLTLKGDANTIVDQHAYVVRTADRVLFEVPKLGYVAAWLTSPIGLVLLGVYAAFLLSVVFKRDDNDRRPSGGRRLAAGTSVVALVVVTVASGNGALVRPTLAAWTDEATAVSGGLKAHNVQRIDAMTCTNSGGLGGLLLGYYGTAGFTFPHKNTQYDYSVRFYNSSKVQQGSEVTVTGSGAAGGTLTYNLTATYLASLLSLGGTQYVRIYSKLKSPNSAWVSTTYREFSVQTLSVLGLGVGIKCGSETDTSDLIGPAITFTSPTGSTSGDAGTFQSVVRTACGNNRPACGTVSDPAGIKSISYQFKRVRSNGTEYFHASSGAGGIWNSSSSFEELELSSGVWKVDGLITTAYYDWNENMAFTLTVKAIDNYDNETTSSISFTLN